MYYRLPLTTVRPASITVNADDFGISEEVNHAIFKSFEHGIISSTSLLVNMPGFDDAIEKIQSNSFLKNTVGIHLNIMEGSPVSDSIKKQKRFCDASGRFAFKREQHAFRLNAHEKDALGLEIKSQIDRAIKQGVEILHVDSHHGALTEWGIAGVILNVLKDYKIRKIRIARNLGNKKSALKEIYKSFFNSYLKFRKFEVADWFGDLDDFYYSAMCNSFDNQKIEIMVHPVAVENSMIRDFNGDNIGESLRPLVEAFQISAIPQLVKKARL
jgi:chitin disaccharide deacetylase